MNKKIVLGSVLLIIVIAAIVVVLIVGKPNNISKKLKVVATTTQLYDFTKNIVGDKVDLQSIFKPNVDPHEYEPTPDDVKTLNDADVIIENGVGLEKKINSAIQLANKNLITASDFIQIREGNGSEEESAGDPHIWFSVPNAEKIVEGIALKMGSFDLTNKDLYVTNENIYIKQLQDADTYVRAKIAELPVANRKLVTNHDAFGYYIDEYGLTFVGSVIPDLSTEVQPTPSETNDLIAKIKDQNVKAIFTESSINPKLAEQIAQDAGVKPVSDLYGDTLGEIGSNGETYIKMIKYNTDVIVENLK